MKTLYLIGGPMGVGKTTVGKALEEKLKNAKYIEGDDGWKGIPFVLNEENRNKVLNNIIKMINDSIDDYDNIILGWVMDHQYVIDNIINGVKPCNVKVFSLIANEEVITKRLQNDLKKGLRDEGVIKRSIERIPLYNELKSIKIDTSSLEVSEIVDLISKSDYEKLKEFWNKFFDLDKVEPVKEKWINDETFNGILKKYIKEDSSVLDYGCGSGWALVEAYFTSVYKEGIGIDTSQNGIDYSKKLVEVSEIKNTEFYCGDETLLDNYPNYFDFMMSFNCLDVIPDEIIHSILKQLKKSLKKDGIIFIGTNPDFDRDILTNKINMVEQGNSFYKDGILRCNKKTIDEWKKLFSEYFECLDQFTFALTENEKKNPRIGYLLRNKEN